MKNYKYFDIVEHFTYKKFNCQINRYYSYDKYKGPTEMDLHLTNPTWLCGYIEIPYNHALYAEDIEIYREDVAELHNIAHGGITFSRFVEKAEPQFADFCVDDENPFIIGFDCNHFGDDFYNQNEIYVKHNIQDIVEYIIKHYGDVK